MKDVIFTAAIFTLLCVKTISSSSLYRPSEVIHEGLTEADFKELEFLDKHFSSRPKRSGSGGGSGDILNSIKSAVVAGISKKLGQLAKGSAGASAGALAGFSSGSSGSKSYDHYPPPENDHKSYNFWELKKSILNTLLQAVKAIKGGVVAIKGQLIKGSGYVISGGGKLLSSKGDAVTKLGKNIIHSAVLVPYGSHPTAHAEYGPPSAHYSVPSGPSEVYHDSASGPGSEYPHSGPGSHYTEHHDDHKLPHGTQAGILILKKIPKNHDVHHSAEESKIPPFKSLPPAFPSLGQVMGKFLSASTSLNPHKPEPFGHTASAEEIPSSYEQHSHIEHHGTHHLAPSYEQHTSVEHHVPSSYEQHSSIDNHATNHYPHHPYEEPKPLDSHHTSVDIVPSVSLSSFSGDKNPLGTNYGVPFEQNYNHVGHTSSSSESLYGDASQNKPQFLKQNGVKLTEGEKVALSKPASQNSNVNEFSQDIPKPASINTITKASDQHINKPISSSDYDYQGLPNPTSTNNFIKGSSQNIDIEALSYNQELQKPSSTNNAFAQPIVVASPTNRPSSLELSNLADHFYQNIPKPTSTNTFIKSGAQNINKPISAEATDYNYQGLTNPTSTNSFVKDSSQNFDKLPNISPAINQFYQKLPKPSSTKAYARPTLLDPRINKPASLELSNLADHLYQDLPKPTSSNSFSQKPKQKHITNSPSKSTTYLKGFSKGFTHSKPTAAVMTDDQDYFGLDGLESFASFPGSPLSGLPLLPTPLPENINSILKTPGFDSDLQVMHVYDRDRPTNYNKPSTYRGTSGSSSKRRKPSLNVVKSIAYELTPDGPKRLERRGATV